MLICHGTSKNINRNLFVNNNVIVLIYIPFYIVFFLAVFFDVCKNILILNFNVRSVGELSNNSLFQLTPRNRAKNNLLK